MTYASNMYIFPQCMCSLSLQQREIAIIEQTRNRFVRAIIEGAIMRKGFSLEKTNQQVSENGGVKNTIFEVLTADTL
jgi:hypothetical protein